jgi:hypothetical protein
MTRIRLFIGVFCFLISSTARADVTGSIAGTITDPSGGLLAGAVITATEVETNFHRQTTTNSSGQYKFLALPAGTYALEAKSSGFKDVVITGIVLTVNQQFLRDISMQIGAIETKVEVAANPVQVEAASSQLGDVIDSRKMEALPLNGRSYIDLLGLQAGVAPTSSGGAASTGQPVRLVSGSLAPGQIAVNGQRESANAFYVNGGDVSEGRNLGTEIIPNLDSIGEFRLITNSFDAEYGRFSGGVVNAITKSGGNGVHGAGFEFLRNDAMDARNFFDPTKAVLKRNQFGYAVGGPFVKDRLFWFTDYQGTRETQGLGSGLVQVPTAAERSGDFAGQNAFVDGSGNPTVVTGPAWAQTLSQRLGYTVTAGEPYSTPNCTSTINCVFPGAIIPQAAFSPAAKGTLKFIPLPNSGSQFFADSSQNQRLVDDKAGQRVDFINRLTGNWAFYYFYDDSTLNNPLAGSQLGGFPAANLNRGQLGSVSNTRTISPTAVNEFRLNYTRSATRLNQSVAQAVPLTSLGFQSGADTLGIVPAVAAQSGLPRLTFNNFQIERPLPENQINNTWSVSDGFSKVAGRHTLKFGGDFRYFQVNETRLDSTNGRFTFTGSETGTDFADYLLGAPATYAQGSLQQLDERDKYGGIYGQDSFRIRPNLTLNLGLRWESSMPWYDKYNRIQTIVPGEQSTVFPTAPEGLVFPGDKGIANTLAPTRYNAAPRIGLAYSPGISSGWIGKILGGPGKTSIRAAFGIYYTAEEGLGLFSEVGDAPFGLFYSSPTPPLLEEPFLDRADGVSQGQRYPFTTPARGDKNIDFSLYEPIAGSPGYSPRNVAPYAEHFNFSIQRQLATNMVLSLAYVGTEGHHLLSTVEGNPGNPGLCLSLQGSGVKAGTLQCGPFLEDATFVRPDGSVVNGTRPLDQAFSSNGLTTSSANSTYNSLQVSLQRSVSDFTFLAAYTYGKALDDASNFYELTNHTNSRLTRALSNFDVTHNFVISYTYEVPFARAMRSFPKRLTEGWSISGITRFSTGFPVTLAEYDDTSLAGAFASGYNLESPNITGPLSIQDPRRSGSNGQPNQYFNGSVFTLPALGTYGDANRRFFHGPGIANWDMSLHKTTRLRENLTLQFRAEFFNVFNHAQFNNPQGLFDSSQFGEVTSARDPRIGQLSLKMLW